MNRRIDISALVEEDSKKVVQKVNNMKTMTGQPPTPVVLSPDKQIQGPGGLQVGGPGPGAGHN